MRILFARIGWMKHYAGPQSGDERPRGGGRYTSKKLGHEVFNFFLSPSIPDKLFGFIQPATRSANREIALERIDPSSSGMELAQVTVIFVAKDPKRKGQRIVGWYKDATLHRTERPLPKEVSADFAKALRSSKQPHTGFKKYRVTCRKADAVLLPFDKREFLVPGANEGGFGQSNVFYIYDAHGRQRSQEWIPAALKFAESYKAVNLLVEPEGDEPAEDVEIARERSAGFQSNIAIRREVERYAMSAAKGELARSKFVAITDTHLNQPYDFTARKDGRTFYIEVKGTQTKGETLTLTRGEVNHVAEHPGQCLLLIVSSVKVQSKLKPRASGGEVRMVTHWNIAQHELKAIAYSYEVPRPNAVAATAK